MLAGEGAARRSGTAPVHLGVATDHVIESFRNELWAGYKTGAGVAADLLAQFPLLEDGLVALGVKTWPMVELEADDALATAAQVASADPRVGQVVIWTPDKDLGQCVEGRRVVQYDRRARTHHRRRRGEGEVRRARPNPSRTGWRSSATPPTVSRVSPVGASSQPPLVLEEYRHLESIPLDVAEWAPAVRRHVRAPALVAQLSANLELAVLFRVLATLQIEPSLLAGVDELAWRGPQDNFDEVARYLGDPADGRARRGTAGGRPDRRPLTGRGSPGGPGEGTGPKNVGSRMTRRSFLGVVAGATGAAVGATIGGCSSVKTDRPSTSVSKKGRPAVITSRPGRPGLPPNRGAAVGSDQLPQFDHLVVVMMENHSFDNMIGMLGRGDGFTLGPTGRPTAANPDGRGGEVPRLPHADTVPAGRPSLAELERLSSAVRRRQEQRLCGLSLGTCIDGILRRRRHALHLRLARTFPLADRWFCSVLAETYPNRRYLLAGTSLGLIDDSFRSSTCRPTARSSTSSRHTASRGTTIRPTCPASASGLALLESPATSSRVTGIDAFYRRLRSRHTAILLALSTRTSSRRPRRTHRTSSSATSSSPRS